MNDSDARDGDAQADESPFIETPDDRVPRPGTRPGGLSVICAVAIMLAVLGLLIGLGGLLSLASQARLRQAMAAMQQAGNQPLARVQQEFNDRMFDITNRYRWATVPLMIAKIAVEIGLLAGAIFSLRLDRRGGTWLTRALFAAIVVEALYAVPTMLIQRETREATTEMMSKMMAAGRGGQGPPAGAQDFAAVFGSVIGIVSLVVAVGWLVAKIIFYLISIRYLQKPEIARLFEPPPDEPSTQLA